MSDCIDWEETKDSVWPRINTVAELSLLYLVFVPIINKIVLFNFMSQEEWAYLSLFKPLGEEMLCRGEKLEILL